MGEREILVVATQCLLLPTRTHHNYTTHYCIIKGGGVCAGERVGWVRGRS